MCTFRHDIVTISREVVDGKKEREQQEGLSTQLTPGNHVYGRWRLGVAD